MGMFQAGFSNQRNGEPTEFPVMPEPKKDLMYFGLIFLLIKIRNRKTR